MDKNTLSQSLWNISNIISGFAVAQTATFTYACANEKFGNMINTFGVKFTLAASMTFITAILSYIVWWCSKKQIIILQLHDKKNNSSGSIWKNNIDYTIINSNIIGHLCKTTWPYTL